MRLQCRRKPRRRQPHQPGASQKAVVAERPMRTGSPKASEPCRSSPRFPLWRGRAASHRRPRPSCRCSAALSEAPPEFLFALIMRILLPGQYYCYHHAVLIFIMTIITAEVEDAPCVVFQRLVSIIYSLTDACMLGMPPQHSWQSDQKSGNLQITYVSAVRSHT